MGITTVAQGGPKGLDMGGGAGEISLGGTKRSCRTDCGKTGPYLANLWPSVCIAVVSVGCFKPTWYVCRMIPRAPEGLADASGLGSDIRILHERQGH